MIDPSQVDYTEEEMASWAYLLIRKGLIEELPNGRYGLTAFGFQEAERLGVNACTCRECSPETVN